MHTDSRQIILVVSGCSLSDLFLILYLPCQLVPNIDRAYPTIPAGGEAPFTGMEYKREKRKGLKNGQTDVCTSTSVDKTIHIITSFVV